MKTLIVAFVTVVLVLLLLAVAAVVLPMFLPARTSRAQSACVKSLRLIQTAKTRWADVYHRGPMDRPTESDLFSLSNAVLFSKGTGYEPAAFERMPVCPAGSDLIIGAVNEEPRCSSGWPSHSLHPNK